VKLGNHESQESRIAALLRARGGWVSAVELSEISLQYSARVHSLRKQGIAIQNRVEIVDGVKHGYFRLKPVPQMPQTASNSAQESRRDAQTPPQERLFSESELTTWHDPEEEFR
jgi:hypothetical protein